jgi:uncharacterized protein YjbJ (UPF0337 family)
MAMGDDDKIKGKLENVKGRAKTAWGELTGDKERKAEGTMDKGEGKLDELKGNIKNAIDPDKP